MFGLRENIWAQLGCYASPVANGFRASCDRDNAGATSTKTLACEIEEKSKGVTKQKYCPERKGGSKLIPFSLATFFQGILFVDEN